MHLHNNAWPPRWSAAHARRRRRLDWLALAPAIYTAAHFAAALAEAAPR